MLFESTWVPNFKLPQTRSVCWSVGCSFLFYLIVSSLVLSHWIYLSFFLSFSIYLSIYLSVYLSIYLSMCLYSGRAGMHLSLCLLANSKQCRCTNIDNAKDCHPTGTTPKPAEIRSFNQEGCQSPPTTKCESSIWKLASASVFFFQPNMVGTFGIKKCTTLVTHRQGSCWKFYPDEKDWTTMHMKLTRRATHRRPQTPF